MNFRQIFQAVTQPGLLALVLVLVCEPAWAGAPEAPRILADKEFYTKGSYIAYAAPWSVDLGGGPALQHQLDYADEIVVQPSTFPSNVEFSWHWPLKPPANAGVYGYHAVSFGSYYGGVPEVPVPARRVKEIRTLTETFRFEIAHPIGDFNVLTEFFLAQKADDDSKMGEIGFFLRAARSARLFAADGEQLGTFTDGAGLAWIVAKQPAPHGPFYLFIPAGEVLAGTVDFKAALEFLRARGQVTGEEYFTGLAFGVEPVTGSGSLRLHQLSVGYQ